MSDYREQSELYKAQRREPAPDDAKVPSKRKKRPKPFLVQYRWRENWHTRYKCSTLEEARKMADRCLRSTYVKETRIFSEIEDKVLEEEFLL